MKEPWVLASWRVDAKKESFFLSYIYIFFFSLYSPTLVGKSLLFEARSSLYVCMWPLIILSFGLTSGCRGENASRVAAVRSQLRFLCKMYRGYLRIYTLHYICIFIYIIYIIYIHMYIEGLKKKGGVAHSCIYTDHLCNFFFFFFRIFFFFF